MRRLARSLAKPLAFILIAAQLLLALPASASSVDSSCAGMSAGAVAHHCPCCPDGVNSMKDCLASCTLAAAVAPNLLVAHSAAPQSRIGDQPAPKFAPASEPPLKPPPIA